MSLLTILALVIVLFLLGKSWRFFLETSEDIRLIRLLEPWFWFAFLNLLLSPIIGNYDYQFEVAGLILQLVLCSWFSISMSWIVQSCHHKSAFLHHSWFQKGKTVKFCFRCGTRLPKDLKSHMLTEDSWQSFLFQIPAHLFEYIVYWIAQSVLVLIVFFLVLRVVKKPEIQHSVVLWAVGLVILAPLAIFLFGRARRYTTENKGLIWWEDFRGSVLYWGIVIALLWFFIKWVASS
jgi:hypothetical protein